MPHIRCRIVHDFAQFDCLRFLIGLAINIKRVAYAQWYRRTLCPIRFSKILTDWNRRRPLSTTHAIAKFQQLYDANGVHCSSVCGIFGVECRRKVHYHHATHMFIALIVERLDQRAAVCFVGTPQRVIWIRYFIQACVNFLVQKVLEAEWVYLYGHLYFIRHKWVALWALLHRVIHRKEKGVECKRKGIRMIEEKAKGKLI